MSSAGTVILTVGTATVVNALYNLEHGKEPTISILAGATVATVLVITGSASGQWEFVEAVGFVFLAGSLFKHGADLIKSWEGVNRGGSAGSSTNPQKAPASTLVHNGLTYY